MYACGKIIGMPIMFFLLLLHTSCSFITFERLHIRTNVSEYGCILNEPSIRVDFSIEPVHRSIEEITALKAANKAVQADFEWNGSSLYIKPHKGWEKGRAYTLTLDGNAEMKDKRFYKVFSDNYFYYGSTTDYLILQSYEPQKEATIQNKEPLVLLFNKSVNRNSFHDVFNITPSLAYSVLFEENDTKITITPQNTWPINGVYTWSIKNLKAKDGYPLHPGDTYRFFTPTDSEHPTVISVCPVTQTLAGFQFDTGTNIDLHIREKKAIGFIFSKQPDYDSLRSAFSIEPSLKGYLLPDPDDKKRYIYIPQENYGIHERYRIKISTSLTDTTGLPLVREFEKFFTSADEFLTISEIKINNMPVAFGPKHTAPITDIHMSAEPLTVSIRFSTAISDTPALIKNISLSPVFPATANSPHVESVHWDPTGTETTTIWKNFSYNSPGIDNFYTLTIPGTKSGITNGSGSYMEDTICAHIRFPKQ